ncbi:hypothetical protein [Vagococcus carniphilus]|uniref:hypothetical protein n=1 Tax=Vagococcus carniphilus TaxID=218144 RepID=UPI003B5A311E
MKTYYRKEASKLRKDKYFYPKGDLEVNLAEINMDEREILKDYVEKTRHFIEITELYKIFRVSVNVLREKFVINYSDLIEYKGGFITEGELSTYINLYTSSFLSTSKTLVDSIETYIEKVMGKDSHRDFRSKSLSKTYDSVFSYRLLNLLRNYSQHGHIPVEITGRRASFNIDDILRKPHTSGMNERVKKELSEKRDEILTKFNNNPHLSYSYIIFDINYYILKIYSDFLMFIKKDLLESHRKINKIITRPNVVDNGYVFYDYEDDTGFVHCFNSNDNIMELYTEIKKNVRQKLTEELELLKKAKIYLEI